MNRSRRIVLGVAAALVIAVSSVGLVAARTRATFDASACLVVQPEATYLAVRATWANAEPAIGRIDWTALSGRGHDVTTLGVIHESWPTDPPVSGSTFGTWGLADLGIGDWSAVAQVRVTFRDQGLVEERAVTVRQPHGGWSSDSAAC